MLSCIELGPEKSNGYITYDVINGVLQAPDNVLQSPDNVLQSPDNMLQAPSVSNMLCASASSSAFVSHGASHQSAHQSKIDETLTAVSPISTDDILSTPTQSVNITVFIPAPPSAGVASPKETHDSDRVFASRKRRRIDQSNHDFNMKKSRRWEYMKKLSQIARSKSLTDQQIIEIF